MAVVTGWSRFMQAMLSQRPRNSRSVFSIGINGELEECVFEAHKTTLTVGNFLLSDVILRTK
jgi:hypothetical protein